jgi:hypothetical protein
MKSAFNIFVGVLLMATLSGCVHSHRAPHVVYEPAPASPPQTVVITPTSEKPVVRVYPEPDTVVVTPSSQVKSSDLEMADRIRRMFQSDESLSAIARNVRITVQDGLAIMTGSVLTAGDRSILQRAVASTPGLYRVDNRTQVELNR